MFRRESELPNKKTNLAGWKFAFFFYRRYIDSNGWVFYCHVDSLYQCHGSYQNDPNSEVRFIWFECMMGPRDPLEDCMHEPLSLFILNLISAWIGFTSGLWCAKRSRSGLCCVFFFKSRFGAVFWVISRFFWKTCQEIRISSIVLGQTLAVFGLKVENDGITYKACICLVGDFLLCNKVNHHQTTFWNIFVFRSKHLKQAQLIRLQHFFQLVIHFLHKERQLESLNPFSEAIKICKYHWVLCLRWVM